MKRLLVIIGAILTAMLIGLSGLTYLIVTDRICIEPFCTTGPVMVLVPPANATMERPILIEDGRVVLSGPREISVSVFAPKNASSSTLVFGECIGFEREFTPLVEPIPLGPLAANTTTVHETAFDVPIRGPAGERFTCFVQINDDQGAGFVYGSYILELAD